MAFKDTGVQKKTFFSKQLLKSNMYDIGFTHTGSALILFSKEL